MTRPGKLADADRASPDAILAASAELAAVAASVRDFAVIMNERRGRKLLEPWMTAALATGEPALRSFVAVGGHVNRIKMLKRQMYGRASPDLLRRRVLWNQVQRPAMTSCSRLSNSEPCAPQATAGHGPLTPADRSRRFDRVAVVYPPVARSCRVRSKAGAGIAVTQLVSK